jgi:5-carboxymethyl-2-hydroxymuconate isomerase
MPHIIIECSANVRERTDLATLVECVHETALATGVFPIGGTRTRVEERTDYRIADGDPANAFVHVVMRIGHGRDEATKRAAAEAVFATVCDVLQPAFDAGPLGISLELQEIDPVLSFKKNNLHDYVQARRSAV